MKRSSLVLLAAVLTVGGVYGIVDACVVKTIFTVTSTCDADCNGTRSEVWSYYCGGSCPACKNCDVSSTGNQATGYSAACVLRGTECGVGNPQFTYGTAVDGCQCFDDPPT